MFEIEAIAPNLPVSSMNLSVTVIHNSSHWDQNNSNRCSSPLHNRLDLNQLHTAVVLSHNSSSSNLQNPFIDEFPSLSRTFYDNHNVDHRRYFKTKPTVDFKESNWLVPNYDSAATATVQHFTCCIIIIMIINLLVLFDVLSYRL